MRNLPEMSSGEDKSGTTAVCAFVSPKGLFIANCGDSRAMLCRNGVPVFSTQDHKPGLPSERDRIVSAGGRVMIQRVNGTHWSLAVFFPDLLKLFCRLFGCQSCSGRLRV